MSIFRKMPDVTGMTRKDCDDGYTEFRKKDGSLFAVMKTWLVQEPNKEITS